MDISTKHPDLLTAVQSYCADLVVKHGTQTAAASSLNMSDAQFIAYRRGDWDKISERKFNEVAALVGVNGWQLAETRNFTHVIGTLAAAHDRKVMIGITGFPGAGKTEACNRYCRRTPGAYYLLADTLMSRTRFISAIMRTMGMQIPELGNQIPGAMVDTICSKMIASELPVLLVIDDAGKLKPEHYRIIQIIYDRTKDRCGIVLAGTEQLKRTIDQKAQFDVMGFRELQRRFSYWEQLQTLTQQDVLAVCRANGIDDTGAIAYLSTNVTNLANLSFMCIEARERAALAKTGVTRDLLTAMNRNRTWA
jgi:DNA transposition AAA+ family ATPase